MVSAAWITNAIGTGAGICTALSMLPQLIGIWRSRSGRGVSVAMFLVFGLGVVLWIVYGFRIHSIPVIAANGATLAEIAGILTLKARYDRQERAA